jgi:hypothetical protein
MIKGPKLRLKAIAPSMAQKTLRELKFENFSKLLNFFKSLNFIQNLTKIKELKFFQKQYFIFFKFEILLRILEFLQKLNFLYCFEFFLRFLCLKFDNFLTNFKIFSQILKFSHKF